VSDPTEVIVEVWPVAADDVGLWLISGADAWRSEAIRQDSDPHSAVENVLERNGALEGVKLLHSTSWRADQTSVILTYVAVIGCKAFVRDRWKEAAPINPALPDAVGKPNEVHAAEAPIPRYIDVLMHGLRHLQFLLQTDSSARSALCGKWPEHLAVFRPALAGMYDFERGEEPITLPEGHSAR
ncbi:hypothetical protein JYK22_35115, partial [Nonomuraea sp. RK-328]|nr:hypothetical protein [Nonomuraea sp. RK-328]